MTEYYDPTETVTISAKLYEELKRDALILSYLESAGIDNTDAYSFGMERYYEDHPEEDL